MRLLTCIPLYISISTALRPIELRQASTTPTPNPFSANAAQLISLYIPSSIQSILYSYYTSLESTTGDPASVIEAAFTATTNVEWLEALPTQYDQNIEALQSAISSLRVAATGGVGASVTPEATTTGRSSSSEGSGTGTASGSARTGSSVTSEGGAETTGTTEGTSTTRRTTPTISFDWGSTSSSGFGVPTRVPVAAAGVLGFVGAILVL
ncbi:hypothetical protein P154DRAFT_561682 [Amniculicola lignicola CBS 123094]|uniref:Uncharacterized protein n=1 Tax=Amniculicola lignicola CBS 123094 TaxID=1392246 RepID=A0A6A5WRM8_9PLEO|nr:hypothetical protein P154DRAFT_561682 [Amniculicola lignicola CBS 123094]